MPLSEHEQRLLEQMEQALYAEDPKFASQMQGSSVRARLRRRVLIGGLTAVVGLVLVMLGVMSQAVWLGGIGFALLVAGAAYAITPPRTPKATLGTVTTDGSVRTHAPAAPAGKQRKAGRTGKTPKTGKTGKSGGSGSFMARMEERWDRRRHDWQ